MDKEQAGWLVALAGAVGTAIKYTYDFLKRRSDNSTKLKLQENSKEEMTKQELMRQHKEVLSKLNEVERKLDHTEKQLEKAMTAFDIILPLVQELFKERPEYKEVLEKAMKHLTPKTN